MTNTKTLSGTFGVASGHPTALTLSVQFTETAVNAAKGTSTVTAVVKVTNTSDTNERWYRYMDAKVHVRVGNSTKTLTGKQCWFDLKSGKSKTLTPKPLTWTGVNHRSGSVGIGMNGTWPQGPSGHNSVPQTPSTLTLNSLAAAPTSPLWPSNGNAISAGPGTSVVINWTNRVNVSTSGVPQISPYNNVTLAACQSAYPDHFAPSTVDGDVSTQFGSWRAFTANYAVQTFWYTTLGSTLPSPALYGTASTTNVSPLQALVVRPPANPPSIATGWGIAIQRSASGHAANPAAVVVQGTTAIPLTRSWVEPWFGPVTSGPALPSSSFADTVLWSTNTYTSMSNANGAQSFTFPAVGGYWYQFYLRANNNAGSAQTIPMVHFVPGTVPSVSSSTSGDLGEGTSSPAPQANVSVGAEAFNDINLSCSVIAVAAATIDPSLPASQLSASADAILVNYCGDPRQYWLTASTSGNNTASPYVNEKNTAAYTSHNAQALPQQMTYAMAALGLAAVDRGAQFTYLGANNNTGSTIYNYIFIGGNPDSYSNNAAFPVPANAATMQVSALTWANCANTANNRTVSPFSQIRFNGFYANGISVAGETNINLPAIPVNTLVQQSATYTIPANTVNVTACFQGATVNGANWQGGMQAGDQVTTTAFMVQFNGNQYAPYFDGGWPGANLGIIDGGDLSVGSLSNINSILDGDGGVLP